MPQPKIEILAVYRLEFTDEQISQFIEDSLGDALDENAQQDMLTVKRAELSSVAAFDVLVTNADESFDAGNFTQPDSDQVAYDEVYLSADGRSVESDSQPKDPTNFRMYFFLHFVDNQKPLLSSYGEHKIPKLKAMPDYLRSVHPFTPVD
jgi:hypothetical protein